MMCHVLLLLAVGTCLAAGQVYYYQGLNRPQLHTELGMHPQYHGLVYNYIAGFAGSEHPQQVHVEEIPLSGQQTFEKVEEFGGGTETIDGLSETDPTKEATTDAPLKPGLQDHALPSDFLLLRTHPQSQFFGNFDAIKMSKMKYKNNKESMPPLGGVVSNYVLLRDYPNYHNYLPFPRSEKETSTVAKRQAYTFNDEEVVINSGESFKEEKPTGEKEDEDKEGEAEEQPAVAQSKPSAIALAGPGGVAQASPVGTAVVGPGGLAVSAPSGTAVAGPAGQGAIIASADEKMKTLTEKKRKEQTDQA